MFQNYKIKKIHFIILLFIVILCASILLSSIVEPYTNDAPPNIIGYFHVCQCGEWRRSFDLIMEEVRKHGLYDNTSEIRIGIVSEPGNAHLESELWKDPKFKIIYTGNKSEYERHTLKHMKSQSYIDPPNTRYYYLHTKGIKHFNTPNEEPIVHWIRDMLYWNIQQWKNAIEKLEFHSTYGCNYNSIHYSGNFWWATSKHIQTLSDDIPDYYTAPEDWVLTNKDKLYCANNCHPNFKQPYPDGIY